MANGIGFSTFIKILNAMNIPWKLRTDNDIFKIPKRNIIEWQECREP